MLEILALKFLDFGKMSLTTEFPKNKAELSKNVEVKQTLDTGTSKYPISYKLRKSKDGWANTDN